MTISDSITKLISGSPAFFVQFFFILLISIGLYTSYSVIRRYHKLSQLADDRLSTDSLGSPISGDNELVFKMVEKSIEDLKDFARKQNPDQIVGVHTGGRLVSALICRELDLDSKTCTYLSTDQIQGIEPQLSSNVNRLSGNVLIIDDITRGGSTLEAIRRTILRETYLGYFSVKSATYATLLAVTNEEKSQKPFFKPDWFGAAVTNNLVKLPWSALSAKVKASYLNRNNGRQYDPEALKTHELLIRDFGFSLFCAQMALEDPEEFELLSNENLLIEKWSTNSHSSPVSPN